MNHLKRAAFLSASVAALGAPALAAGTPPPLTTIHLGESADVDATSIIWMVQNGIWERLGLTIDGRRLNSGSAAAAAVVGGSLDVGASSIFGLILAHLRGVPFVLQSVQAVYDSTQPNTAFVVAKDSPIKNAAGLNGATVSTAALGDLFQITMSSWIDQNGGNSKTVNFVELPVPTAAPAIAAGRVAGAVLTQPFLQDGLAKGQVRILGHPFDVIAPRFGVTYYFTTQAFAQNNADVLARFRRGLAEQVTYALRHKSEILSLAAKVSDTGIETVQHLPWLVQSGLSLASIQLVIDAAAKYKVIPRGFPASELVDPNALT